MEQTQKTKAKELLAKLEKLQYERKMAGKPKSSFLIWDDDEYQDQLELRWHIEELDDEIEEIKESLNIIGIQV